MAIPVRSSFPILVIIVGAWQLLFASTGLGHVVKFTPHPVLASFVTGIGVLMIVQ